MKELPPACEKCEPYGGRFQIIERNGTSGAGRCDCPRGQELAAFDQKKEHSLQEPRSPRISQDDAAAGARALTALPGCPFDEIPQTMIANELLKMCHSGKAVLWLVRRMMALYNRWPGVREMRLVYCEKTVPVDGFVIHGMSEHYPDGFPSEHPTLASKPAELPSGQSITADPILEAAVKKLAQQKAIPPAQTRVGSRPEYDV